MGWVYLFCAGLFEIIFAVSLKYTEGFTRLLPCVVTFIGMVISLGLLSQALKFLPLGLAYAVWTGIGTLGTLLYSIFFLKTTVSFAQIICILMIICGVAGLKFFE